MRLSDLRAQLKGAGDVGAFAVYLAAPDKDGIDVDLASVGRVEVDHEKAVARIYPASTTTDADSVDPEPFLDMVLNQFPRHATDMNDLRLLAEVPLLRDDGADERVTLVDIVGVHIGRTSEEVWFLVRPASEFAAGLLPA
jgi:hypothetical protein